MRKLLTIILAVVLSIVPIACGPSDTEKAEALIASRNFPQAVELLRPKAAANPEDADIQFLLGVALINRGQLQAGDERFVNAFRLNADYGKRIGREYKKAGDYALDEGRTGQAVSLFEAAVRRQPDLKSSVGRSFYEKGKALSLDGKDARAIELHRYAMVHDPLLGKDIWKWYAVKAEKVDSASEKTSLRRAASDFKTAYSREAEKSRQAAAKEAAAKSAMSVKARMKNVIEQRLDENAWQRIAVKSSKMLGNDETVEWSVKYYRKAGYEIKRLRLNDREWTKIGNFANRSSMFFLSAKDFWYQKSSLQSPQFVGAAITRAKGIQFYGDEYIDIWIKTETPPHEVFYWVFAPNQN